MHWPDYIEQKADVMMGKPVFKGTRLTVETVLQRLGEGWSENALIEAYPRLTHEHVKAACAYAAASLSSELTILLPEPVR
jgi:uncharacterized protein (DUF433 family)